MSVATEITRLQSARNQIRTKMVTMGLAVGTDTLDELATKLDAVVDRGAVEAEIQEGETYTIPAGYHNGSGTVSGIAGGGNYTLQEKTVVPTKTQQSITPDEGKFGLSAVTVAAIPDNFQDTSSTTASASDVLANKVFIDAEGNTVTGTIAVHDALNATIDGITTTSYTLAEGYYPGGTVSLSDDIENALAAI